LLVAAKSKNLESVIDENNFNRTSIPKSIWKEEMFFVFKNPFRYAVAGYGVFNCVNGGVMRRMSFTKWT